MPGQVGPASTAGTGGGITNSAGANVVTKSDGTNLVASTITDTGTVVTVAAITKIGADGAPNSNNTLYAGDANLESFGWGNAAVQYGQLTYAGGGAVVRSIGATPLALGAGGTTSDVVIGNDHSFSFGAGMAALTFNNAAYKGCTALTTSAGGLLGCTASDERLKNIHGPSAEGLAAILQITPQKFEWKDGRREGIQSGLIAQDVQRAIPLGVSEFGDEGMLQLEKDAIIGAMINAFKELNATVEDLRNQVAVLSKK